MSEKDFLIRTATPDDAAALAAIYRPYVEGTAITFEYEAPTEEEFKSRIAHTLERYPYLVAQEKDDPARLLGYAYAGVYHGRAAYSWSVETSIYVAQTERGRGLGKALHHELEKELKAMGIQNMYACITALPEDRADDPYLTDASIRFHEKLGYELCARFRKCGYKFSKWYDVVWMEHMLGKHPTPAPELSWME
ncbi:MAG: N-acetyltransferase family protein [Atopobium sp.]|nr:N-acetyltransferase family protein [Atopobium sp.]RRF98491.1 MAG: N-acetyltransferase [Coriobacteriaceae bacterium]